ncbi:hypothetical protein M3226_12880 [Neobacillus cucumis]|uniref:hypothetical protein n=1 Tax=Neobacillus cucumis TaxID=1740721 RepID=UPI00203BA973|nr:hypothetical protein [Neobacillus cucumis]MCM3726582.1 hypothetical protein [Neobacillus cucumis]
MNKWLWYSFVVVAVVLLILSMLTGRIGLSITTLALALLLKRFYHTIPLPDYLTKNKVYSSVSGKTYNFSDDKKI